MHAACFPSFLQLAFCWPGVSRNLVMLRGAWLYQLSSRCHCRAWCRFGSPELTLNWRITPELPRLLYATRRRARAAVPYGLPDTLAFSTTWSRWALVPTTGGIPKLNQVTSLRRLTAGYGLLRERALFPDTEKISHCQFIATQLRCLQSSASASTIPTGRCCRTCSVRFPPSNMRSCDWSLHSPRNAWERYPPKPSKQIIKTRTEDSSEFLPGKNRQS